MTSVGDGDDKPVGRNFAPSCGRLCRTSLNGILEIEMRNDQSIINPAYRTISRVLCVGILGMSSFAVFWQTLWMLAVHKMNEVMILIRKSRELMVVGMSVVVAAATACGTSSYDGTGQTEETTEDNDESQSGNEESSEGDTGTESSGESETTTSDSTGESDDGLPDEQQELFEKIASNVVEIDKIYCDCENDLCSGLSAEEIEQELECTERAIALDPLGSIKAMECDEKWSREELACLKAAKSCDNIEMPPDDAETCEEISQDILQDCPAYPKEVEQAIEDCPAYAARRVLVKLPLRTIRR